MALLVFLGATAASVFRPVRGQVELVEIWSALAAFLDGNEGVSFKLLNIPYDAPDAGSHVSCQTILAWETVVVLPRVAEQHCVSELSAW